MSVPNVTSHVLNGGRVIAVRVTLLTMAVSPRCFTGGFSAKQAAQSTHKLAGSNRAMFPYTKPTGCAKRVPLVLCEFRSTLFGQTHVEEQNPKKIEKIAEMQPPPSNADSSEKKNKMEEGKGKRANDEKTRRGKGNEQTTREQKKHAQPAPAKGVRRLSSLVLRRE